ncbi:Sensory transduction protein LytR [compost metagenome]
MRAFTLIVVDDDPLIIHFVEQLSSFHPDIQFLGGFRSPLEAKLFLSENKVDIVILDIEMPDMSGLELATVIQEPTRFIFSTSHDEFALEGFNLAATDYLLKPYEFERFKKAVDKIIKIGSLEEKVQVKENPSLTVKSSYSNTKLLFENICYIESIDDYVIIFRDNGPELKIRKTLKNMLNELPEDQFVRIHRSYIVPYSRITGYQKSKVFIGEKELPLSASYKDEFLQKMKNRK